MSSVADDDEIALQRKKLLDELRGVEEQLARGDEIEQERRPFPREERVRRSLESRREDIKRELTRIEQASARPATPAPASTVAAAGSAAGSGAGQANEANHPIEAVAGKFVRVADLLAATLDDGDNAFSSSTRQALNLARLTPRERSLDRDRVIGPDSFLRAILSTASQPRATAGTLGDALFQHLLQTTDSYAMEARIRALVPSDPSSTGEQEREEIETRTQGSPWYTGVDRAVADPNLTRALADAARITRQLVPGQTRIDVTHAIIAVMRTESGQGVLQDLWGVGSAPQEFFTGLADTVRKYLIGSVSPVAPRDVIESIHASLAEIRSSAPPPDRRSPVRYVSDLPALSLEDDRLGMADDVRALAEVISLRQPGPPLAIGLFGDWGSGKSTFMNMLKEAIQQLTSQTQYDEAVRDTLVSRVVHIHFNAWHYNDGNLWASLTSEFFSQLRAWNGSGDANYAALVREVLAKVQSLEVAVGLNEAVAAEAQSNAVALQTEIDDLQRRRQTVTSEALASAAGDIVRGADDATLTRIESAVGAIGRSGDVPAVKADDPQKKRDALVDVVQAEIARATTLPGRVIMFLRAVWSALRVRTTLVAATLLWAPIVLAFVIAIWPDVPWSAMGRLAAAAATLLVSAAPGVLKVYRTVEPLFRGGDVFVRRRREAREQFERDIASKRADLEEARRRKDQADHERSTVEAEVARFRGATPARVFDYYLNASPQTRQFERQLGTVSQVRRAFEQLDAIFRKRDELRARAADVDHPKPEERARAQRELAELETQTQGLDRIVLYIDDLDRCQVSQVVKVLEAVHLLLAFRLFVVVVGVDARWLEQSLLNFYDRQLRDVTPGTGGAESTRQQANELTAAERRATVQDYLEKIFQIPIRLEPLAGATASSMTRYLESVAGPIDDDKDDQPPRDSRTETPGSQPRQELLPVEVRVMLKAEHVRTTVTRLQLKRPELKMIEELSPLLGKSPRAVKRFMNIYRMVRGRRRGDALQAFVSKQNGSPALFPAYQFWLALDIGLRPEQATLYRNALHESMSGGNSLASLATELERAPDPGATTGPQPGSDRTAVQVLKDSLDRDTARRHAAALRAVATALPDDAGRAALLEAEHEIARFSLRAS